MFQVLKDHNNDALINVAVKYFYEHVKFAAMRRNGVSLIDEPQLVQDPLPENEEETQAKLVLLPGIPTLVHRSVLKAIQDIKFTKISFFVEDKSSNKGNLFIINSKSRSI